jgi:glycine/D-amino acid oxidase-like deaminating enzyme
MNRENYDVIVIGGGAIGLATAYQLGKRKAKTLVQYKPFPLGSKFFKAI